MTQQQTPANLSGVLGTIDLRPCGATPETLTNVIGLAIEIAREGREGRRIGTIFTVGAESAVLQRSRCLILDPLAGHPLELLHIDDPNLRETVKELAQLDGGFVVSGSGYVLSACRYFEATLPQKAQPLGLGTRHLAAASISASTGTLAVVVSESSVVRIFSGGQLLTEILPELWLLSRYMPHLAHPTYTSDQEQNLAILSEASPDEPSDLPA
jgi:DNA integrity scanning protein DisA with diadenylate cyclase activity